MIRYLLCPTLITYFEYSFPSLILLILSYPPYSSLLLFHPFLGLGDLLEGIIPLIFRERDNSSFGIKGWGLVRIPLIFLLWKEWADYQRIFCLRVFSGFFL